jgi:HEAT repeat protein
MDAQDDVLRSHLVSALGDFLTEPAVFELVKNLALHDPDKQIRRSAVATLGYSKLPGTVEILQAALKDPDEYVTDMAKYQLELLEKEK